MLNHILKEFENKYKQLKVLIVNDSLSLEESRVELSKYVFALNTIKSAIKKNKITFSEDDATKVEEFLSKIADLKNIAPSLFENLEEDNILAKELKENLPETIHTDALEQNNTL